MKLSPEIIVTGFSDTLEGKREMDKRIEIVQKEFLSMGIPISVVPDSFTIKDVSSWVREISTENDFYINIQEGDEGEVLFKTKKEKPMAKNFSSLLSQWTDSDFIESVSLAKKGGEIFQVLSHLSLHSWNITLPNSLSEKELVFSIMGCITDLYTRKHSLIEDDKIWPFRDVPSSHFAFSAIKKAKEQKVITGYKGDIFYPNGGITRGEVLYMLEKLGKL